MGEYAIQVDHLYKRFPRTAGYRDILTFWRRQYLQVLQDVTLHIPRGGVFGILGPNGAGKTTLLKVLAGLITPDAGGVSLEGVDVTGDPDRAKTLLTYVPADERTLYWRLTGRQNLQFFAVLNEIPSRERQRRVAEVLDLVGLADSADEQVVKYSTGMKQRLAIARGLLCNPGILLLDEPTRSLDPVAARQLQRFIKDELASRLGKTVVLATHNMEEATDLCDLVAVLHRGQVRAWDRATTIAEKLSGTPRFAVTLTGRTNGVVHQLQALPGILSASRTAGGGGPEDLSLELTVADPERDIPAVVEFLVQHGERVMQVSQVKASLTDAIAGLAEEAA
jgi:ABC-2 type transport system ATP-binding protein